jgi:hypothetical protein
MSEAEYSHIIYGTTLHFANGLARLNSQMIFEYVSGSHTDSSEKGSIMWARVKGKTESALTKVGLGRVHNFCPGFMNPTPGQRNIKTC